MPKSVSGITSDVSYSLKQNIRLTNVRLIEYYAFKGGKVQLLKLRQLDAHLLNTFLKKSTAQNKKKTA
jgi:hypothetical protein